MTANPDSALRQALVPIPVSAAKKIAAEYGYDQVVVIARRVGEESEPHGEHVTTYGKDRANCDVAARIGNFLKFKVMGWLEETKYEDRSSRQALVIARGALAPFARAGGLPDDLWSDDQPAPDNMGISIADLRRAREAHALITEALQRGEKTE